MINYLLMIIYLIDYKKCRIFKLQLCNPFQIVHREEVDVSRGPLKTVFWFLGICWRQSSISTHRQLNRKNYEYLSQLKEEIKKLIIRYKLPNIKWPINSIITLAPMVISTTAVTMNQKTPKVNPSPIAWITSNGSISIYFS